MNLVKKQRVFMKKPLKNYTEVKEPMQVVKANTKKKRKQFLFVYQNH